MNLLKDAHKQQSIILVNSLGIKKMNLFSPNRPKLVNQRPTWLRNHIAIPHLELFPLEDGNLEISIWLPIKDETFSSMRFTHILSPISLHGFIQNFINDPEETCEFIFKHHPNDALNPELRNHIRYTTPINEEKKVCKQQQNGKIPSGPDDILEF